MTDTLSLDGKAVKPLLDSDLRFDSFSTGIGNIGSTRIVHLPTGLSVECSGFRSATMNRYFALGVLTERVNKLHKP